jgi:hypothetical protein
MAAPMARHQYDEGTSPSETSKHSLNEKLGFHVQAMEIGLALACVVRGSREGREETRRSRRYPVDGLPCYRLRGLRENPADTSPNNQNFHEAEKPGRTARRSKDGPDLRRLLLIDCTFDGPSGW